MQWVTTPGDPAMQTSKAAEGRFAFLGEALPLDLVNTEQVVRGKPVDLLATPAEAAAWWRAAAERYPGVLGDGDFRLDGLELFTALVALRAAFRRIFETVADGGAPTQGDLEVLNAILRSGYVCLEPDTVKVVRAVVRNEARGPAAALLPLARAAVTLLTERDLTRLHRCGNARCVLLFYDTTKSATRRWCSQGCMNRARSTRRYHERRAAGGDSMR